MGFVVPPAMPEGSRSKLLLQERFFYIALTSSPDPFSYRQKGSYSESDIPSSDRRGEYGVRSDMFLNKRLFEILLAINPEDIAMGIAYVCEEQNGGALLFSIAPVALRRDLSREKLRVLSSRPDLTQRVAVPPLR